jgi:hypothetical protein
MLFTGSRYHGPQRSGRAMIPLTNPHTWAKRTFILFLSLLIFALTGCAGSESGTPSAGTGSGSSGRSPSAAATATTSTTTSSPSEAPSGPAELPVLHEGASRAISPGTYVTTKPDGFFPGLTLTIPAGWSATEADSGELALHPADRPDDAILLWKDMVAVVTNNRSGKAGQPLKGVGSTADALVKWLTSTSDFAILAKPKTVTVGDGVKGKQLTVTTSNSANLSNCQYLWIGHLRAWRVLRLVRRRAVYQHGDPLLAAPLEGHRHAVGVAFGVVGGRCGLPALR